jgi:hypothetical protein
MPAFPAKFEAVREKARRALGPVLPANRTTPCAKDLWQNTARAGRGGRFLLPLSLLAVILSGRSVAHPIRGERVPDHGALPCRRMVCWILTLTRQNGRREGANRCVLRLLARPDRNRCPVLSVLSGCRAKYRCQGLSQTELPRPAPASVDDLPRPRARFDGGRHGRIPVQTCPHCSGR